MTEEKCKVVGFNRVALRRYQIEKLEKRSRKRRIKEEREARRLLRRLEDERWEMRHEKGK